MSKASSVTTIQYHGAADASVAGPIGMRHDGNVAPISVLILAVIALALSLPMIVLGPMPAGHDTIQNMNFGKYFAEQFWQGELYPRWLLNMNHGLGSPTLFVYPPFPSYVYALLLPEANAFHVNALGASGYLCLLTSGLSAFLWMSTLARERISMIVAGIYMLLPYHLDVDLYRRCALAECWALAWMPLVFYFTVQVVKNKRYAMVGLSAAYALLIVSHLISILLFSALPLLLAWTLSERGQKMRAILMVSCGLALGTTISAAYLFPALASARYFPVDRLGYLTDFSLKTNLLAFGKGLLTGNSMKTGFVQAVSLCTLNTALFIATCGLMALRNDSRDRRRQTLLWLAVCIIPLFLMSSSSLRIWKALPVLAGAVQFPWRLNIILCVAVLPLAAFFLSDMPQLSSSKWNSLAVIALFAATWLVGYGATVKRYALPAYSEKPVNEADGWFDAWKPHGMNEASALQASMESPARLLAGQGTVTVLRWSPRHIDLQTDCIACGPMIVNQFYYPDWTAKLASGGQPLSVGPALPEGLLEVTVPPGHQQVRLEIPRGVAERVGDWVSFLSGLTGATLCVLSFTRSRSRRLPGAAHD